ncbi:hypothetical protein ACT3S2_14155 [Arthrobacter sp. AOP36-A1-22]|uniref:hypothetical protein n=1 Tax=Arthrobacter sp. AOP36-A1-22 TaxID=3457684 RepID=UPI0040333BD7
MTLAETADAGFFLLGLGGILVALGVQAYRGAFRRWRGRTLYAGYLGPGLLYLGSAFVVLGATLFVPGGETVRNGPVGWVMTAFLALALVLGMAGGLFAFIWMPRVLRPTWVREVEGNAPEEAPAGPLPEWTFAVLDSEVPSEAGPVDLSLSKGPRLGRRGLDYLDRISYHDRRAWKRVGSSAAELVGAGLAEFDGAPTSAGLLLTLPRRAGKPILRISTDDAGRPRELSLFRSAEFDYAIWTEGELFRVDALPHSAVPMAIIGWLHSHAETNGWNFIRGTNELMGSFVPLEGSVREVTSLRPGTAVSAAPLLDSGAFLQRVTAIVDGSHRGASA